MPMMTMEELGQPETIALPALRVTGTTAEYTMERTQEIPQQWAGFIDELTSLDPAPRATYGVVRGERGRPMRYTCGIAAGSLAGAPDGWETVEAPAALYAVFKGNGGAALIQRMWPAIWQVWLPASGRRPAEGPMVEFYSGRFAEDGGPFEIRIPLEAV